MELGLRTLAAIAGMTTLVGCGASTAAVSGRDGTASRGDDRGVVIAVGKWQGTDSPLRTELCAAGEDSRPFQLDRARAARRYGSGVQGLRASASTIRRPIEVCGAMNEVRWLAQATCDDGSNPYGGSRAKAHSFRRRAVSDLDACTPTIDIYEARCPEGVYAVFMDMDLCGPDEDWHEAQHRSSWD